MLTIFTIPKPFKGHIQVIQRNALQSWLQLAPACEVFLCGNDAGVRETASEFDVHHIKDLACTSYGTPLLSSAFTKVQEKAHHRLICYVNADIILLPDFLEAVKRISFERFLMVGQRWDLDVETALNYASHGWIEELLDQAKVRGYLHPPLGSDYFVFPRGVFSALPDFAVGRAGWDNWLIYHARTLKMPVVDATAAVTVIHQNHDYAHVPEKQGRAFQGPESDQNLSIIGDPERVFTLLDATWLLTPQGLERARSSSYIERARSVRAILHPKRAALYTYFRGIVRKIIPVKARKIYHALLRYVSGVYRYLRGNIASAR